MTAASFWSLLAPAIEISEVSMGSLAFIPVAVGFALGALFVHLSDNLIPSCVGAELSIINVITKECLETDALDRARKEDDMDAEIVLLKHGSSSSNQRLNNSVEKNMDIESLGTGTAGKNGTGQDLSLMVSKPNDSRLDMGSLAFIPVAVGFALGALIRTPIG